MSTESGSYTNLRINEISKRNNIPGYRGYITTEEVGSGTQGDVHRAVEFKGLRTLSDIEGEMGAYAVKIYKDTPPPIDEKFEELHSSSALKLPYGAHLMSDLSEHPNIPTVHSMGNAHIYSARNPLKWLMKEKRPVVIMDHIEGTPINKLMSEHGLSTADALRYLSHIGSALSTLHTAGEAVHLDIKPEHVHIGTDDAAYLLDFDIAEPIGRKTLMSGTRNFMAPEQFRSSERIPENDVYGFGVLAYTMLTGTTPINPDDKSLESFRNAHEQMRPPSFTEILTAKYDLNEEQIPATLLRIEPIIQGCLEKDAHKRPSSVKAILTAFDDAYYEGTVDDRQKSASTNTFRAVPALGQDILNDTIIAATIARTKRYEEIQETPQTLAYTSKEAQLETVEGPVCWLGDEFAVSDNVKSPEFYAGAVEQLNKLYQEFKQSALENIRATFATDTTQDDKTAAARDSWATTIAERQALKSVREVAWRQFNLNLETTLSHTDLPTDLSRNVGINEPKEYSITEVLPSYIVNNPIYLQTIAHALNSKGDSGLRSTFRSLEGVIPGFDFSTIYNKDNVELQAFAQAVMILSNEFEKEA